MCLAFKPVSWELIIYFKDQYQVQAPVRHHNWWLPHLDNNDRIKNIFKISVIGKTFGYLLDLVNLFRVYARRVMELNNLTRWHTLKEILQLLVPRGYLHFFTSQLIITFAVCTKHAENVNKGVLNSTFFSIWLVFNRAFIESGQGWSVSLSRGLLEVDIESRCLQILPFVYFLDKGHCCNLSFWKAHGFKNSFLCLPCVLNVSAVLQIQNQIGLDVISLLLSH